MNTTSRRAVPAVALSCALLQACAYTSAPDGFLATPSRAEREAFGGWASVECDRRTFYCHEMSGELIAINGDSVYLLTDAGLVGTPLTRVDRLVVSGYDSKTREISLGGVAGIISTASHGLFAIISAPVWIITTVSASAAQSHLPQESYPAEDLNRLRKYARFPQGLPEGVSGEELKPKPPRQGG